MSASVKIPPNWKAALDADIGAPETPSLDAFENTWFDVEHGATGLTGGYDQGGRDNPFDTTVPEPGSSSYNSVGVQNYPSYTEGARATAQTLEEPAYSQLLADMRSGRANLSELEDAENASPWGSAFSPVPEELPAPGTAGTPAQLSSITIPSQFYGGLAGTGVSVNNPVGSTIGTLLLKGLFIALGGGLIIVGGYKTAGKSLPSGVPKALAAVAA